MSTDTPTDALMPKLQAGIELHSANDLDAAEAIYEELLALSPEFVPALHMLGRLFGQRGDLGQAEHYLERALALIPEDEDVLADVAQLRGLQGRTEEAESSLRRALASAPRRADLHYMLAQQQLHRGVHEDAIGSLQHAVSLQPDFVDAHSDLGAALIEVGRVNDARRSLEQALALDPAHLAARMNLARCFRQSGDHSRAKQEYAAAIQSHPNSRAAVKRLADLMYEIEDFEGAFQCYESLSQREPEDPDVWKRQAETASKLHRWEISIESYQKSLELDKSQPATLNDLGSLLASRDQLERAAECLGSAVALQSDLGVAFQNLGGVYHMQGRHEEALHAYENALKKGANQVAVLSQMIGISNYRERDADRLEELYSRYLRSVAPERVKVIRAASKNRSASRRLRVGYVSPDFRQHSVCYFIEPVISGHDRHRFEVFCYSDVKDPDEKTRDFKAAADQWREMVGKDHAQVASLIEKDQIDILVDLNGHCADNRLPVFAQKPAPVQVTYLGYPATSGLPEMDYRLTDEIADPLEEADDEYSETLLRLPDIFLCYRPPKSAPAVASDAAQNVALTFGSFNEWPKVSASVVRVWSRILESVPGSRLLIKARSLSDEGTRIRALEWFKEFGVDPSRIELTGRTAALTDHLAVYSRVDIALDTFPYNGTTTTCEALHMGVPVVTLRGSHHVGRVGASLLSAVALDDCIADSEPAYIEKAVTLAGDARCRKALRETLRDRLEQSALCDEAAFVRKLEAMYGEIWQLRAGSAAVPQAPHNAGEEQPDHRIEGALGVEIADSNRVWVPDELSQLTPYVLLEQEDWFEDEIKFVREYLDSGMRALDVGANFGLYTLTAARQVGQQGQVFSFEPTPTTFRWLSASISAGGYRNTTAVNVALGDLDGKAFLEAHSNSELNRLVDEQGSSGFEELVEVRRLDSWTEENGISGIDFVKLDAEGAEKQILHGGRRFFNSESPLLMFEIKSGNEQDWELVSQVKDLGYLIYRLVPGLGVLFPVDESETLDPFTLNLFACNDACREKLIQRNLLGVPRGSAEDGGAASEEAIWRFFDARPYARGLLPDWRSDLGALDDSSRRLLLQVLGNYVAAHADACSPAIAVDHLRTAYRACSCSGSASVASALKHSSVRIALELGWRKVAVQALAELVDSNRRDFPGPPGLPFLCASAEFEPVDPGDRFAQWHEASVLDAYIRARAFSSFFEPGVQADLLTRLRATGFELVDMQRRRLLVEMRNGNDPGKPKADVLIRAPGNRNPTLWQRYPWSDGPGANLGATAA